MSYILEALKKSEQERNADKVPTIETAHVVSAPRKKEGLQAWHFGVALLIINIAVVGYWLGTQDKAPAQQPVASSPVESQPELVTPVTEPQEQVIATNTGSNLVPPVLQTKQETQPEPEPERVFASQRQLPSIRQQQAVDINALPESVVERTNPEPVIEEREPVQLPPTTPRTRNVPNDLDRAAVPDISELPLRLQEQIPGIEFTTHIYVKSGGSFVIINGKTLGDGSPVDRGLDLVKIVSDGIILEYRGQRFFLASLTNW